MAGAAVGSLYDKKPQPNLQFRVKPDVIPDRRRAVKQSSV
jgi:hypothetical protein